MKKKLIPLLGLCLMMTLLTTGAAYAAEISDATSAKAGVSVTVLDSKEGVDVTYSAAENGSQYLIIVLNDDSGVPTKSNIVYMNQTDGAGAAGDKAEFATVLPSTAAEGKTCNVYLSSNASSGITKFEKVGTFKVGGSGGSGGAFVYGNVDGDAKGRVNNNDLAALIRYLNKWPDYREGGEKAIDVNAANVDGDAKGRVNNNDLTVLIRHLNKWPDYKDLPYKSAA